MVARSPRLLVCMCWLLLCGGVGGQAYNSADYVRNLYRKYLNREPTSNELTQWVWSFQKGLSLADAQATFLSSDEYFARYARNSSSFVVGIFHDVLDRAPTANESLQWLHRLNRSQGNRQQLVRDFLKVTEQVAASPPPPPPEPVTVESQLVAAANLLHRSLEQELGGTSQGRQLAVMSRNFMNACRSLEKSQQVSPEVRKQALAETRTAWAAMNQQMERLYFAAPASSNYLSQCQRLLEGIGEPVVMEPLPAVSQPQPAADSIGAELYEKLAALNMALVSDVQQMAYLLRAGAAADSRSSQLLRDVEFFQSQVVSVQQDTNAGTSREELRHDFLRLRALSEGVTRSLQRSEQVGRVAQRWEIVLLDLQQIGELFGVAAGPAIDPGQPVLINLPTYHRLPYQVQRPTMAELSQQAIPLTDQALAYTDAFIAGFNRFLHLSPRVPALQAQARTLRVQLGEFRTELTGAAVESRLQARLVQINQALRSVESLWTRTVQERQLTNSPDPAGISGAIRSLNELFPARS